VLGGSSGSIRKIELSKSGSALVSSTAQLGSGHNSCSKSSFIAEGEDRGSIEHNVEVSVVFKARKHLSSNDVVELEGETLGVTSRDVLCLLVKSRETHESRIANSSLEDTLGHSCGKVSSYVEGSLNTSDCGEVEGSSVESWKLSLGLKQTDVGV